MRKVQLSSFHLNGHTFILRLRQKLETPIVQHNKLQCYRKVLSGGSRGSSPPLFLDQTEARRAEKVFFETAPPPPYLRV